jgi:FeS assembly SUF system protein
VTTAAPNLPIAVDAEALRTRIIETLRSIYDPEIPVNIYDLGLIYGLDISDSGEVKVRMTLTAPGCPVAQTFPGMVEATVMSVNGVRDAKVVLTWDPPWTREMMSEVAQIQLGMI